MSPPIPIIILNWNGLADTRECLAALERQTYRHFEVYLVDNGSAASEVRALAELYSDLSWVKLVLNETNLGFTRGNNQILRDLIRENSEKTTAPYVALLNNDTAVQPQWLEALLEAAQEERSDMVASKMINYYDRRRMDNAGHQLLNTLEILPIGHDEPISNYNLSRENVGPCAGAALYSTAMLREIGLFDEHFSNGYEDVELGLRGIICGYRSVFAPRAEVFHKISRSVNKIRDFDYTLSIQQHIYYIIAKLTPRGTLVICLPFLVFRTGTALLVNLLFFRWKFLRVQYRALYWLFGDGWRHLQRTRKDFFQDHETISSYRLLKKMDFFLKKDLQRFYKYLIKRDRMVFEKYD